MSEVTPGALARTALHEDAGVTAEALAAWFGADVGGRAAAARWFVALATALHPDAADLAGPAR